MSSLCEYIRIREEILNLLGHKCAFCNETASYALDIHHVYYDADEDPSKPSHQKILTEIKLGEAKFMLLCRNHHRQLHKELRKLSEGSRRTRM